MDVNHKNEITLKVCKEMNTKGVQIDYEVYHKIMKMVYRSHGQNSDYSAKDENNHYKSSYNDEQTPYKNDYANKRYYNNNNQNYFEYNNNYHYENNQNQPEGGYNKYNNYTQFNNGYKGKWKK